MSDIEGGIMLSTRVTFMSILMGAIADSRIA